MKDYHREELRWMNAEDDKETEDAHLVASGKNDTMTAKLKPSAATASFQNLSTVPSTVSVEAETKTITTRPEDRTPSPQASRQNEQANDRKPFPQKPLSRITTSLPSRKVRIHLNTQCDTKVDRLQSQTNEEEEDDDDEDESIVLSRKEKAWRLVKDVLKLHESLGKKIPPPASPFGKTHRIGLVAKEDDMVSHLASLSNCNVTVTHTPTLWTHNNAY